MIYYGKVGGGAQNGAFSVEMINRDSKRQAFSTSLCTEKDKFASTESSVSITAWFQYSFQQ